MSYSDFTLAQISKTFGVIIQEEVEIFSDIPEVELDQFFQNYLRNNIPLVQAIGTEKAKSEMIVAPVLIEVRRILCLRNTDSSANYEVGYDSSAGIALVANA